MGLHWMARFLSIYFLCFIGRKLGWWAKGVDAEQMVALLYDEHFMVLSLVLVVQCALVTV